MTLVQTHRSPTKSAHPQKQIDALIPLCGVEYQHQVLSQKEQQLRTNNFIRCCVSGVFLSFVLIQPLNGIAEWAWRTVKAPNFDPTGLETNFKDLSQDSDFNRTLKTGDKVLQWTVTSPFGERIHPVTGERRHHNGVDLDTPEGTPIHAIGKPRNWGDIGKIFDDEVIYVECGSGELEGNWASVTSSLLKDYRFNYFHLMDCYQGSYASGAIIGRTGNTGRSTGAHLHFEVELKGKKIDPPMGFLRWTLEGKEPQPIKAKPIVERLRNAIAGQESGHNPNAVNPDSFALGYGQVMPENITEWTTQCLGAPITEAQFMASKETQIKVIDCKLAEYLEANKQYPIDLQIRKVASMWYSGRADLYDNPTPQTYGAGSYPSIREYTTKVLERFKEQ